MVSDDSGTLGEQSDRRNSAIATRLAEMCQPFSMAKLSLYLLGVLERFEASQTGSPTSRKQNITECLSHKRNQSERARDSVRVLFRQNRTRQQRNHYLVVPGEGEPASASSNRPAHHIG